MLNTNEVSEGFHDLVHFDVSYDAVEPGEDDTICWKSLMEFAFA